MTKQVEVYLLSAILFAGTAAMAQHTVAGPHGGTASGTVTRRGNTVTGSGTATGARGNTASGSGSVTKTGSGLKGSGSVTGPKGGTTTASGTSTNNPNGTKTISGAATGPRGQSKSGSGTTSGTAPTTARTIPAKK